MKNQKEYRSEIDGLRAIAVISVVLYHVGVPFLPGGFTGVDVFFVISGYLITGIIYHELSTGDFSTKQFYIRRIRRILPVLFVVVAVTLSISFLVALPEQVENTAASSLSTLLSVSNIYFWLQSGYFSPNTDFMPLLHTWSLGVEEQFYIVFPLFLLLIWRFKLPLFLISAILIIPLFAISIWLSVNKPSVAFYLLPARMWELGLGACIALLPKRILEVISSWRRWHHDVLAFLGVVLIVAGMFFINSDMLFPGYIALIPTVGAALTIIGSSGGLLMKSILSNPFLRFFGLISYSLYLWHWPVIVFARMITAQTELNAITAIICILISVSIATFSWWFVERPTRDTKIIDFAHLSTGLITTSAIVLSVSIITLVQKGFPGRVGSRAQELMTAGRDFDKFSLRCIEEIQINPLDRSCRFGTENASKKYVIIGDSHAAAIREIFAQHPDLKSWEGSIWWRGGCPLLIGARVIPDPDHFECTNFKDNVVEAIRKSNNIDLIILAGRFTVARSGIAPEIGGNYVTYLRDSETAQLSRPETERVFDRSITRALQIISEAEIPVLLVGAVPEPGFDVPRILALAEFNGRSQSVTLTRQEVEKRVVLADASLEALANAHPNVEFMPIWRYFCDEVKCYLLKDGISVYRDDDHITATTAKGWLATAVAPELSKIIRNLERP